MKLEWAQRINYRGYFSDEDYPGCDEYEVWEKDGLWQLHEWLNSRWEVLVAYKTFEECDEHLWKLLRAKTELGALAELVEFYDVEMAKTK